MAKTKKKEETRTTETATSEQGPAKPKRAAKKQNEEPKQPVWRVFQSLNEEEFEDDLNWLEEHGYNIEARQFEQCENHRFIFIVTGRLRAALRY